MWEEAAIVYIDYTNWRGERSVRRIMPEKIVWACSEWHPENQWLLLARDCDKSANREFAMSSIHGWSPKTTKPATDDRTG